MTTYTVVSGAAGENGTLPTLAAAAAVVKPGDVVDIAPGVYRERLICNVPRVTWRSTVPGAAVIDGGWNGKTLGDKPAQIAVSAAGVVLDGLTVRNAPGDGIGVGRGAHGTQVLRCTTDTTYSGGIICNAGERLNDVLISECVVLRAGSSWPAGRRPLVSGSMNLVRCYGAIVERCKVGYGYGEGINIDKGSVGVIVRGCIIFDNAHLCIYFNRSRDCLAEGNLLYLTGLAERNQSDGNWPAGIVIGDECGGNADTFPFGGGNVIRGNVIVNCGTLLWVRNNATATGYNTSLDAATIMEHNTLVAGPLTRAGIRINENVKGRPHGPAKVRGNAVHFTHAAPGADMATNGGAALVWERNAWTQAPPRTCDGPGDVIGFQLVDAGAAIPSGWPAGEVTANLEHYRPTPLSTLIGAGPDGSTIGALAAASEEPPVEPPPPVDLAALVELAQQAVGELSDLTAHGSATLDNLALLLSNVAAAKSDVDEIGRHAGEARLRLDEIMARIQEATG